MEDNPAGADEVADTLADIIAAAADHEARRSKVSADIRVAALEKRVEELEDLYESTSGLLSHLMKWANTHGNAAALMANDLQNVKEYLGVVPQQIRMFDGINHRTVFRVNRANTPDPDPIPSGSRHDSNVIEVSSESEAEAGTTSASALPQPPASAISRQPPASALPPPWAMSRRPPASANPAPSGTALPIQTASATAESAAPPADETTQAGESVVAPPGVVLIPPTPQTSQDAAAYAAVPLVPMDIVASDEVMNADCVSGVEVGGHSTTEPVGGVEVMGEARQTPGSPTHMPILGSPMQMPMPSSLSPTPMPI